MAKKKYILRDISILKKIKYLNILSYTILIIITLSSCNRENKNLESKKIDSIMNIIDFDNPSVVKYNNKVFSVPSPIQIVILTKELDIEYNKNILSSPDNYFIYNTSFLQSLNIGIYGADLAYVNIYEQYVEAKNYFEAIRKLSEELNVANSFSNKTLNRLEKNNSNQDSVFCILATAYRKTDAFLLENNQKDIGILIIAGGWIESMFFMMQNLEHKNNQKIINRIGDQKQPLKNLIDLLLPYYGQKSESYDNLIEQLADLDLIFDEIEQEYIYKKPDVFKEEKLTVINSQTVNKITDEQLKQIKIKIEEIRQNIIKK